ncbi:MAG: tetratricopeptide repeat protein [Saprospiraceae bacterium]|nr:tetratricopeptide repeat protein [Saprospiraceae bacterium]
MILSSFLSLVILFPLTSCEDGKPQQDQTTSFDIPELLPRNEKLQYGKEWDDVMNQYQKLKLTIQKNTEDHASIIKMAHLFIREARITGEHGHYYPAALSMTEKILQSKTKINNTEFLALVTKAGVLLSLHEFNKALETGQKALLLNADNAQIYGVMTDCYVELGMYDKAVEMADKMISIKPDLRSYARISYLREIHGQIPEAIQAMKMAVEAGIPGYEDTAWAMFTLAELLERYGETEKAKLLYEEILAARPEYPFAISALGALQLKNKNLNEAESTTLQAIQVIPEVGFYTQLAEIYKKQGKKESMDTVVKDVFQMLKDDEKSGHNMNLEYAHIYLDLLEDPDNALVFAQKEYEKRPNNIDVNRLLARIYKAKSNDEMVRKYITLAKSTNSRHPELNVLTSSI